MTMSRSKISADFSIAFPALKAVITPAPRGYGMLFRKKKVVHVRGAKDRHRRIVTQKNNAVGSVLSRRRVTLELQGSFARIGNLFRIAEII